MEERRGRWLDLEFAIGPKSAWYPLVMTNSLPWKPWPIEIDGLPINSMVNLSMANC